MKVSIFALLVLLVLCAFTTVAQAAEQKPKTIKLYRQVEFEVKCLIGEEGCDCWDCTSFKECNYTC
ncbi:transmembrane protein, putative (macronuclear) [Tetrahymena thermophila SB210]|uniref:Transmembrane protein, putative n=1 Tax=Tetrahymena thermophila (strain SB210) TaxID=312017 RepID=Q23AN5_TETTS|nr:transmembrane protein, putative [Tetrahymena thermophila SB210]EAR93457.1 transmembrane protein, putative [Tetrahymena thermophila SB210]|eukprot:XP_001013702.1 transmembrane protein, putative [Tetrahymena thermophila SB210]